MAQDEGSAVLLEDNQRKDLAKMTEKACRLVGLHVVMACLVTLGFTGGNVPFTSALHLHSLARRTHHHTDKMQIL